MNFIKHTKPQIKALLKREKTQTIFLVSSNVYPNFNNMWIKPYEVLLTIGRDGEFYHIASNQWEYQTFESLINSFFYYNCNHELGNRVHFYTLEGK